MTLCSIFRHHSTSEWTKKETRIRTRRITQEWDHSVGLIRVERCVFIVHDFIYHLNPLGRILLLIWERTFKYLLVKTQQFVKCTEREAIQISFHSLNTIVWGVVQYWNQDCDEKNNIGRNYNINKINDLRDVYQFAKTKKPKTNVGGERKRHKELKANAKRINSASATCFIRFISKKICADCKEVKFMLSKLVVGKLTKFNYGIFLFLIFFSCFQRFTRVLENAEIEIVLNFSNSFKWNKWLIPFLNHSFLISYVFQASTPPSTFSRVHC